MDKAKAKDCWDFLDCPKEDRKSCRAYDTSMGSECWLVASTYCPFAKNEFGNCFNCPWYKKNNSD